MDIVYAVEDDTNQMVASAGSGENQATSGLSGKASLNARCTCICRE